MNVPFQIWVIVLGSSRPSFSRVYPFHVRPVWNPFHEHQLLAPAGLLHGTGIKICGVVLSDKTTQSGAGSISNVYSHTCIYIYTYIIYITYIYTYVMS